MTLSKLFESPFIEKNPLASYDCFTGKGFRSAAYALSAEDVVLPHPICQSFVGFVFGNCLYEKHFQFILSPIEHHTFPT